MASSYKQDFWKVRQSVANMCGGKLGAAGLGILLTGLLCAATAQTPSAGAVVNQPNTAPPAAAAAPQPSPQTPATTSTSAVRTVSEYKYKIGPGDSLDIRIFGRPDFSRDAVTVDTRGYIRMPLIKHEIQAACHTETELAANLVTVYQKFLKKPSVDVFVRQYNSEPVAVIGAVNAPGRFQLQRPVRLLELLLYAGGPSGRAGKKIQIVHSAHGLASACEGAPDQVASQPKDGIEYLTLKSTLKADDEANPYVRPGDLISIAEYEQAYIVGNVRNSGMNISLNEPITISRALSLAGGVLPETKKSKVRILRQLPGSEVQTEIPVDLEAIEKKKTEDVALQPNDIIEVPTAKGIMPFLRRAVTSGAVSSLATLPLRVIP